MDYKSGGQSALDEVRPGADPGRAGTAQRQMAHRPRECVLELHGERYLVAPRGNTEWVRNLRVAGEGQLRYRGRVEPFTAIELPDTAKPPLIEAYLARWGNQVKDQFRALPNPEDHPVFRIEPI